MCSKIVVGVDVAKKFSYFSIALPGSTSQKAFRVNHNFNDFSIQLKKLKELELQFNTSTVMIMEATGHYSDLPSNFFRQNGIEVRIINPIQTSSIKNIDVRKIQSDKTEAKRIADLYLLGKTDQTNFSDYSILKIKNLCRQYFDLSAENTKFINKLTSLVDQIFPNYDTVFSTIDSSVSLYILENYNTPDKIINADSESVIRAIRTIAKKGLEWASKKYNKLLFVANEAKCLLCPTFLDTALLSNINTIKNTQVSLLAIKAEIERLAADVPDIKLLKSIPGFGTITAATFISEIRSFSNFKYAKSLVAFAGIDPAVVQSGTFNGTKVKMSKRGSRHIRKALFYVALASVRKTRNGKYINKVLFDFYNEKCKSKPKKVALVAVMHKLIYYIFAVLSSKKEYIQRSKNESIELFKASKKSSLPANTAVPA